MTSTASRTSSPRQEDSVEVARRKPELASEHLRLDVESYAQACDALQELIRLGDVDSCRRLRELEDGRAVSKDELRKIRERLAAWRRDWEAA